MEVDTILDLRPKGNSSGEIKTSLMAFQARLAEDSLKIEKLTTQRGELLLSGTQKELKSLESEVDALRFAVEQANSIVPVLKQKLEDAVRDETVAHLKLRIAQIDYATKARAFSEAWQADYPRLAGGIKRLCEMEADAMSLMHQHHSVAEQLKSFGIDVDSVPSPSFGATLGATMVHSLGALIRLPGKFGSPHVRMHSEVKSITRTVPDVVYNEHQRHGEVRGDKEITEDVVLPRADREDQPFWWPRPYKYA